MFSPRKVHFTTLALIVWFVSAPAAHGQSNIGTAFTFQGNLESPPGTPVTGVDCDFEFGLFGSLGGVDQIGVTQTVTAVPVNKGVFLVGPPDIDFGGGAFNGTARWLEITVRCPTGVGSPETLSPRVELTPVPYALALPGLYTQQNATSPSLIGGFSGNTVTSGAYGATIGGGGAVGQMNTVTDAFGTVSGGALNRAGDNAGSAVDRTYATVGGGSNNTASREWATVGGGSVNTASGEVSTVGGGILNTANGIDSTVSGGALNTASDYAAVGGGYSNLASGGYSTVGGGFDSAASDYATVGGGHTNTASGTFSSIGGGRSNVASAAYATIAGGGESSPGNSNTGNRVTDDYGTVAGGGNNQAGDNAGTTSDGFFATVGGGLNNTASDAFSTVCGGNANTASGQLAFVGGGQNNSVSDNYSTIGGGGFNTASGQFATVGGGIFNTATANYSTVSGGEQNTASGVDSTVPGGTNNTAGGDYSFAAGRRAKVRDAAASGDSNGDEGTFVWADSTDADFTSTGPSQFLVRASGGTKIYSNSTATVGVELASGGNSWSALSDRNAKENVTPLDPRDVLERLHGVPVTMWNLKSQVPSIRHIGPMAQDFHAAFGLGELETHISSSDADGVALAAIQGLYEIVREKDCEVEELRSEIEDLKELVKALAAQHGGGR